MTEKQIEAFKIEKRRTELRAKIKTNVAELIHKEEIIAKEKELMRWRQENGIVDDEEEEEDVDGEDEDSGEEGE